MKRATKEQDKLVAGLNKEIAKSNVIVQPNQILFHGRGDQRLHELPRRLFSVLPDFFFIQVFSRD